MRFSFFRTLLILVFLSAFVPTLARAGRTEIGQRCDRDSDCLSTECENSTQTENGRPVAYCVCDKSDDCAYTYKELSPNPDDWKCADGEPKSLDLDYCEHRTNASFTRVPVEGEEAGLSEAIFAPGLVANEIQQELQKPQPRIVIPGLEFTDPDVVESYTRTEADGRTYLYIPYLGEYLAAVYRYAIVVAGVLAVVYLFAHGFKIIMGGKSSEAIQASKTRIAQVVIGLVIALTSYVLLYAINPELVTFKNLRVLYVPGEEVEDDGNPETKTFSAQGKKVVSAPLTDLACNLGQLKRYAEANNTLGVDTGYCLRWVKFALSNICQGLPADLDKGGAWDAAAHFRDQGRFVPCTLDGIVDGDIVFMTSMASNYIGLWNNFRREPGFNCTIADANPKATRYDKISKQIVPTAAVKGLPQGMPPVTHVGIYFQGVVYHLTKRVEASSAQMKFFPKRASASKKEIWNGIELFGQFMEGEFISGYGKWK